MAQRSELIERLDTMVAERSLLQHPFYQTWTAGNLEMERLRNYAVQYYRHVEAFPRYVSAIHAGCENLATRQALLENLIEEERGADNHPELWLRFAEGLGLSRTDVLSASPAAATANLVGTFTELTRERSTPAGLAALYAYESQIPAVATAKIDGLRRFYGITNERNLGFFTVHEKADVYHAETAAALLDRHADGAAGTQAALAATDEALTALWKMLDSM